MNRRQLVFAGAALTLGCSLVHGQPKPARIAVSFNGSAKTTASFQDALKLGMREQGYGDEAVIYDVAFADGQLDRLDAMLQDLLARKPDVIVVAGSQMTRAAMKATQSIPIVMADVADAVANKFVASLARPGGNVTGISALYPELLPKVAEVLHAIAPSAERVAVLLNETNPSHGAFWDSSEKALRALGKKATRLVVNRPEEIEVAFNSLQKSRPQGLIVVADPMFITFREKFAALSLAAKLPVAFAMGPFVDAGGLLSYGPSLSGNYRSSARFVAKILKGAKPSDLPVEQPTTFELVINLKTAKQMGIAIPQSVLLRADRVIE